LFSWLALATACLTVGLIVFGAVVRVTDSGLGCGNHWPLCNGTIFPPLDNITAWIEWLHRLFALLIGLCGLAMLVTAIRARKVQRPAVLVLTVIAALLYVTVATLGRYVVVHDLQPTLVTLHLGVAMLLLGSLLSTAILARYRPTQSYPRDRFTVLVYLTAALSFIIILTGALVRGSGAALACVTWPLCNGSAFPFDQGQLASIHMFHRYAVIALGVSLLLMVVSALGNRGQGPARALAVLALVAYVAQAGIGAMYVFTVGSALSGALHVLFAALTWALLVSLCWIETLNSRSAGETEPQWPRQPSAPILNR
jgi:heme A synthase